MTNGIAVPTSTASRLARGRSRRDRQRRWRPEYSAAHGLMFSAPFILLIAALLLYPFVRLVIVATSPPGGVANLASFFENDANVSVMWTTFADSGIVTVITVLLGAMIAWCLRTTQSRAMRLFMASVVFVPFLLGSVLKIYSLTVLMERLGLVNRALMAVGITDEPLHLLYNQVAVVVGMVYQMLPYSVLPLYVAFSSIDLDLVKAAESLGAPRWRGLLSVVVPLAVPGVLATMTIVYVISVGFFLTPVLLGGATSPFTASLIYQNVFVFYDLVGAAVSALALLVGGLVVVYVGYRLVGGERLRRALG